MHAKSSTKALRVALILSGSGVYDGAEIVEASSMLIALSKAKATVAMYAPDIPQLHTINHLTGEPEAADKPGRNVLIESNRIGRGQVKPLPDSVKLGKAEMRKWAEKYDALFFPGGFGVMKNLSNFAVKGGKDGEINKDVQSTIEAFFVENKPIAAACIAPMLLAKVLGSKNVHNVISEGENSGPIRHPRNVKNPVKLTIGTDAGQFADMAVKDFGATLHKVTNHSDIYTDTEYKVVTTPAYMLDDNTPYEIFTAMDKMVAEVVKLTAAK